MRGADGEKTPHFVGFGYRQAGEAHGRSTSCAAPVVPRRGDRVHPRIILEIEKGSVFRPMLAENQRCFWAESSGVEAYPCGGLNRAEQKEAYGPNPLGDPCARRFLRILRLRRPGTTLTPQGHGLLFHSSLTKVLPTRQG